MGSECSILNDTEHDVWITHRIHWPVLIGSVTAALAALTGGIVLAYLGATVTVGGVALFSSAFFWSEVFPISNSVVILLIGVIGTQVDRISFVLGVSKTVLAKILKIPEEKAEKLQQEIKNFQASAKLIKPGEKYTWSGSLSLVKKVYVMNDKLQCDERACFTGPTADSENVYPLSKYFKKLDVKKKPEDTVTVT